MTNERVRIVLLSDVSDDAGNYEGDEDNPRVFRGREQSSLFPERKQFSGSWGRSGPWFLQFNSSKSTDWQCIKDGSINSSSLTFLTSRFHANNSQKVSPRPPQIVTERGASMEYATLFAAVHFTNTDNKTVVPNDSLSRLKTYAISHHRNQSVCYLSSIKFRKRVEIYHRYLHNHSLHLLPLITLSVTSVPYKASEVPKLNGPDD